MLWPNVNPSGCLSVTFDSFKLSESLNTSTDVCRTKSGLLHRQKQTSVFASSSGSNRPWLATLECTSEDFGVVTNVLVSTCIPGILATPTDLNNRSLVRGRVQVESRGVRQSRLVTYTFEE